MYIYQVKLHLTILFCCLLLSAACENIINSGEVRVNFQDPADVTESSFLISWSINTIEYQSLTIFLAEDPDFNHLVESRTFENPSINGTTFENLRGAATYYYRISLVRSPGEIFISSTKSIEMPFQNESISFNTPDMANLKGFISYRGEMDGRRPAVVMMHEFGIFVNGWMNSDLLKLLVADGYICLIFYNRGHGKSTSMENIRDLLDNPDLLANDVKGALSFLQANELVMADSIGLMGGSMGGSMAVAGNGNEAVRTSVALSPGSLNTNSMYPGVPFKSVFYLVGDQDIVDTGDEVIDFPAQATELYNRTENPKELWIIENTKAHGTGLLEVSGVNEAILEWLRQELPLVR